MDNNLKDLLKYFDQLVFLPIPHDSRLFTSPVQCSPDSWEDP